MTITHVALWTHDLDKIAGFWSAFFGAEVGDVYESRRRPGFRSRFLTLGKGPAIEIMEGPWVAPGDPAELERAGFAHVALSLGSEQSVDAIAVRAEAEGILVAKARWTGDGFYEAVLRDPDGNLIEITV
ncbi:Glyoxalase/Bleomycin resistance protein/Dioxygenase superfamily protein [compost metagenome]